MSGELRLSQFRYTTTPDNDFVIGTPLTAVNGAPDGEQNGHGVGYSPKYLVFQVSNNVGVNYNPHIKCDWDTNVNAWRLYFSHDGTTMSDFALSAAPNNFSGNNIFSGNTTFTGLSYFNNNVDFTKPVDFLGDVTVEGPANFTAAVTIGNGAFTLTGLDTNKVLISDPTGSKIMCAAVSTNQINQLSDLSTGITLQSQLDLKAPLLDAHLTGLTAANNLTLSNNFIVSSLTASTAVYLDNNKKLTSSSTTSTELSYVHNVTSPIQGQLDLKAPLASAQLTGSVTHTAGSIALSNTSDLLLNKLTANRVLGIDSNKVVVTMNTNLDELNLLSGVTSPVQSQLNRKINRDGDNLVAGTLIVTDPASVHFVGPLHKDALVTNVPGDIFSRISISYSGEISFGSGTSDVDSIISRRAADETHPVSLASSTRFIAPSFAGDGSQITNVNAVTLGGQPPDFYTCGGSCSWSCLSTCKGSCNNTCVGSCITSCTGGCLNSCTGHCTANCTGTCEGTCSSTCTGGCQTSCTGTCFSTCTGTCTGGCTGTCTGGCEGTCTGTCSASCTADCASGCKGR
jgi:hypothetical protein